MSDQPITVAILTVSDRCAAGQAQDLSGPAIEQIVTDKLRAVVIDKKCVGDEADTIANCLRNWASAQPASDLILTTGGTGLAPRDVTPEATAGVLEKRHPGLLELARLRCYQHTPRAYLSRGEAGVIRRSLVINLPGSPKGATEFLEALLDVLPHAIRMTRGINTGHGEKVEDRS